MDGEGPTLCPVCHEAVPQALLEQHVNMCLDRQANPAALAPPADEWLDQPRPGTRAAVLAEQGVRRR